MKDKTMRGLRYLICGGMCWSEWVDASGLLHPVVIAWVVTACLLTCAIWHGDCMSGDCMFVNMYHLTWVMWLGSQSDVVWFTGYGWRWRGLAVELYWIVDGCCFGVCTPACHCGMLSCLIVSRPVVVCILRTHLCKWFQSVCCKLMLCATCLCKWLKGKIPSEWNVLSV